MQELLNQCIDIARHAGEAIMEIYRSDDFGVEIKYNNTPLTKADLASNKIIEDGLKQISNYPIISEEGSHKLDSKGSAHLDAVQEGQEEQGSRTDGTVSERQTPADAAMRQELSEQPALPDGGTAVSEPFWLVDPIDGTKEFINQNGEFTVNIGLIKNGEPVLGVVYVPAKDVLYAGIKGEGAFKVEGGAQKLIKAEFTGDVTVVVASRSHRDERLDAFLEKLGDYQEINMGSSLKLCLVAEGKAAIYPRFAPTSLWDTAAADAVVRAAGGNTKDVDGNVLTYDPGKNILNPYFITMTKNYLHVDNTM